MKGGKHKTKAVQAKLEISGGGTQAARPRQEPQAAAEGLSLIGDRLYNAATKKAVARKGAPLPYGFKRQALHARKLELDHPASGERMSWQASTPTDMVELIEQLRQDGA